MRIIKGFSEMQLTVSWRKNWHSQGEMLKLLDYCSCALTDLPG